jgi:hypothetical protein
MGREGRGKEGEGGEKEKEKGNGKGQRGKGGEAGELAPKHKNLTPPMILPLASCNIQTVLETVFDGPS